MQSSTFNPASSFTTAHPPRVYRKFGSTFQASNFTTSVKRKVIRKQYEQGKAGSSVPNSVKEVRKKKAKRNPFAKPQIKAEQDPITLFSRNQGKRLRKSSPAKFSCVWRSAKIVHLYCGFDYVIIDTMPVDPIPSVSSHSSQEGDYTKIEDSIHPPSKRSR